MTLDEMLALLADNDSGEISAADMRTIVSGLYEAANSNGTSYPYKWANASPPTTGHVTMDQPWMTFATKALVSETADDGTTPGFAVIDAAVAARLWITTAAGSKFVADVTGPSVDMGTYREVPIHVTQLVGPAPGNNDVVTVSLVAVMP